MGKGIWVLALIMVIIGGFASTDTVAGGWSLEEAGVAYLQNGKIFFSDMQGKGKEMLINLKGEKIKYFYMSPNRVNLAMVTEKDNVYLVIDGKSRKILGGKGEITNVVFMSNSDMAISTICGQVVNDLGESNPLVIHYLYIDGKVKEMSLSSDEKVMSAGKDVLAVFNQSGMLGGSFSIFNVKTGKGKRILTPDADNSYFPEISPDGVYLAYYFKDGSKDAKGGMGIRVYHILEKGLEKVAEHSPIYSYPSSFGPEPICWDGGKLTVHVCFYTGSIVKNTILRIDPEDASYLHEGKYPTKGQYDLLVEDSLGEDILFLYRESEKKDYILYLAPIKGCSEDKIEIAKRVITAKFIWMK